MIVGVNIMQSATQRTGRRTIAAARNCFQCRQQRNTAARFLLEMKLLLLAAGMEQEWTTAWVPTFSCIQGPDVRFVLLVEANEGRVWSLGK